MLAPVIPTRVHALLDYPSGAALMALPFLADLDDGPESDIPLAVGAATLASSLLTDYEGGAVRVLPMRAHLGLDLLNGALLAASPWLFGFSRRVSTPHLALGLMTIGAALLTRPTPARSSQGGLPSHLGRTPAPRRANAGPVPALN